MCLICAGLDDKSLKFTEAWRNLGEMKSTMDRKHFKEVRERVQDGLYEENYCLFCEQAPCDCEWADWEGFYG